MPEGYNRAGCWFIEFDFDNHEQNHLIESMPEQNQAVIKTKDRFTHFQSWIKYNILHIIFS